ncbi:hypothetical protein [Methanobacterium petrolearium]|uniref:hypothetical protein n=1 Tax=Methanobacterium petrolearium TaxID=710190 RepID=UPI001AEA0146|nr:hypothetical protein [Methanobacterium petrolearium]MBP1946975.1 putative membrane protein [Methanobacterium petrolearium]BDZ71478.1 hypothetical protein GCM10025861_19950 [Methanobacterium petrolearium]
MVYDMILPAVPFIGGYLVTYGLYKFNIIKKSVHVNIWNMIIGLAFLISGGAGFILLILLEIGVTLPINQPLLYWHVELGVSLVLVTVFHFHAYWKSARTMFVSAKRRSQNKT